MTITRKEIIIAVTSWINAKLEENLIKKTKKRNKWTRNRQWNVNHRPSSSLYHLLLRWIMITQTRWESVWAHSRIFQWFWTCVSFKTKCNVRQPICNNRNELTKLKCLSENLFLRIACAATYRSILLWFGSHIKQRLRSALFRNAVTLRCTVLQTSIVARMTTHAATCTRDDPRASVIGELSGEFELTSLESLVKFSALLSLRAVAVVGSVVGSLSEMDKFSVNLIIIIIIIFIPVKKAHNRK